MNTQENKAQRLPERSELDPQFMWDLTHIFHSDEEWEQAFKQIKEQIAEVDQYKGKLAQSAEDLLNGLKARDELSEKTGKAYVYAHLKKDENSTNSTYVGFENRVSSLAVQVQSSFSYMVPEILDIDAAVIERFLQENEDLQVYGHELEDLLRQKEHVLTSAEEAILAQAQELAGAPADIFTMINNADMKFPNVTNEDGEELELTHGRYIQFLESPKQQVRKDAFQAMYETFGKQINTLAMTLNSMVKKNIFYATVRKYPSSVQAALYKDNIPMDVYDNLIKAIHERLPLFHRYMRLRKKMLGLEDMHLYDVYVPLIEEVSMKVGYAEAQELIQSSLAPLGAEYVQDMKQAFEQGWIDVYENKGKRSGAYSSGTYGTPPYILLNYQDTLDNVFTLAHELGHSMHSYYSKEHQEFVNSQYTIFVAEVASTLNEALLTHHLLQQTDDPKKKMYILNHYLDAFRGTVFRQTMFAEFERTIHDKVEQGEALTAESLSEIYVDLNKLYYGEDVVIDDEIQMEWARIPHFYMNFYVYKYATGFAAAAALSKQILEEGTPAVERYLGFLRSGGSDYSIELLKQAGVDITTSEPVHQALEVFEATLNELEELYAQHG